MLTTMIKPLLLFKYRLEKAIMIYEMWGQILKLILTQETRLCVSFSLFVMSNKSWVTTIDGTF